MNSSSLADQTPSCGKRPDITYCTLNDESQFQSMRRLIDGELSEPYTVYTYRYFAYNWPHLCFCAFHGERCVGAIVCKVEQHKERLRGYIAMLAVEASYRRRRIGFTLATKAVEAMAELAADEIMLETEIHNKAALRLYENLGFIRERRMEHYYLNGVDAWSLKLILTDQYWMYGLPLAMSSRVH